jgi:hypothetical protein
MPRGVAHEAIAIKYSDSNAQDISLHLTIGIEVATHFTVEVILIQVILY